MRARMYALVLLIIAFAMLSAGCAKIGSEEEPITDNQSVSTDVVLADDTNSPTTTTEASTTTSVVKDNASNGSTTIQVVVKNDVESGNLTVEQVSAWSPTFNVGDLVESSTLCSFFSTEGDGYTWLNSVKLDAEAKSDDFVEVLNPRYDDLRIEYWEQAPTAAENMMYSIEEWKPWLPQIVDALFGSGSWSHDQPSQTMAMVEELTWTTMVMAPASFRTTGCDNNPDISDDAFRTVYRGQNVTVSPDDSDWIPTLMDVVMPSTVNQMLADKGSPLRLRQVLATNGDMGYEVLNQTTNQVVRIGIDRALSVPVIVADENGTLVVVELVFSTVCGNLALPEVEPPEKTPATTTTKPTVTTTTKPTVTTTTTTTVAPKPKEEKDPCLSPVNQPDWCKEVVNDDPLDDPSGTQPPRPSTTTTTVAPVEDPPAADSGSGAVSTTTPPTTEAPAVAPPTTATPSSTIPPP